MMMMEPNIIIYFSVRCWQARHQNSDFLPLGHHVAADHTTVRTPNI